MSKHLRTDGPETTTDMLRRLYVEFYAVVKVLTEQDLLPRDQLRDAEDEWSDAWNELHADIRPDFAISKMEFGPSDLLVVKWPVRFRTPEDRAAFINQLEEHGAPKGRTIVIPPDADAIKVASGSGEPK